MTQKISLIKIPKGNNLNLKEQLFPGAFKKEASTDNYLFRVQVSKIIVRTETTKYRKNTRTCNILHGPISHQFNRTQNT